MKSKLSSTGVFCASSNRISERFKQDARLLGQQLALHDLAVIFGGGHVGMMGALAEGAHEHGGHVVGVIPEAMHRVDGRTYLPSDELIVTKSMHERKHTITNRSDSFIALPGGFGTVDEFVEVVTLRQVGYHNKPIVIVNTDDYYSSLLLWIEEMIEKEFGHARSSELFHIASGPIEAVDFLTNHRSEERSSHFDWQQRD